MRFKLRHPIIIPFQGPIIIFIKLLTNVIVLRIYSLLLSGTHPLVFSRNHVPLASHPWGGWWRKRKSEHSKTDHSIWQDSRLDDVFQNKFVRKMERKQRMKLKYNYFGVCHNFGNQHKKFHLNAHALYKRQCSLNLLWFYIY